MPDLITEVGQLSPVKLTKILRGSGILPSGRVDSIEVREENRTPWSLIFRLAVSFTGDVPSTAPSQLFLKTGRGGEREVVFYQAMAGRLGALPVPPCFEACYDQQEDRSHLLLQDLSDTHGPVAPWPMPPLYHQGEAIVESLAKLHAAWWESPQLRFAFGALPDERGHAGYVDWAAENLRVFAAFLGDRFLPEHRALYDRVLAFLPRLWDNYWRPRVDELKGLTLIHGDAHPGNLLYPKDPGRHPIYLVDWQAYGPGVGAKDLAYMFTYHWYAGCREVMPFLQHYHSTLLSLGVNEYDWETFWLDYQVAVTNYLMDAPRLCAAEVDPMVWWPIYQRSLVAFSDLGCDRVLEPLCRLLHSLV